MVLIGDTRTRGKGFRKVSDDAKAKHWEILENMEKDQEDFDEAFEINSRILEVNH